MGHYMPLTWLTFGWDYVMWEMSAWGYHLDNLLLHAGTALIFYFLALRLLHLALAAPPRCEPALTGGAVEGATRRLRFRLAAAAAALFFACIRSGRSRWHGSRSAATCCPGSSTWPAALAYVKAVSEEPRRVGLFWGSVALFGCALLSKSITATLPATLLVLDIYPLRRLGGAAGWRRWHVWAEKAALRRPGHRRRGRWPSWPCTPRQRAFPRRDEPARALVLALYGQAFYLVKTSGRRRSRRCTAFPST